LSQVQTALSNTTISGYVDVSAQWNLGKQNGGPVAPYSYNTSAAAYYKSDGFNLNVVDLALDKPLDESQWASGYHVELAIGPDGGTLGTDTRYTDNGNFAIRQAYIALRTPVPVGDLSWKVGVFDSPLGYESTSSPLDPNYTRSYGYTIEPTELTGVLATYKVNEVITAQAGVVNDLSARINSRLPYESQKAFLGDIALTAPDSAGWMKGATLNVGVANAPSRAMGSTSWYLGATLPTPVTKLKVGAAFDYLDVHNGESGTSNPQNDSEWVVGLYANFQATDKLSLNLRGEYLSNDGAGAGLYASSNGFYGAAEELTATVQYSLWANVLSRVELRWDHVEHHKAFDLTPSHSSVAHENAIMLALNLIYQF
jgi:hypothetical protein